MRLSTILLKEENKADELADLIVDAIDKVDPNLSYKDYAIAVSSVLKVHYGEHNYHSFMDVLHKNLGISTEDN